MQFSRNNREYIHTYPLFIDLVRDNSLGVEMHEIREEGVHNKTRYLSYRQFTQHIYFDYCSIGN